MSCETFRVQLHAYLDGELDRPALDEVEAHLETCPACRRDLGELEQLRDRVRSAPRHAAPAELRKRIQGTEQLSDFAPNPKRWTAPRWALAASLLTGIALGAIFMGWRYERQASGDSMAMIGRALVSSHLRALAAASPVDVISEDRHTVKPWFAGKIGESPPVVDLKDAGFPLLGGRIDYVGEQRTAVIVYGHRKHVIDVFFAPTGETGQQPRQLDGYTLMPCQLEGQRAWIVTDVDPDTLRQFTGLLACAT